MRFLTQHEQYDGVTIGKNYTIKIQMAQIWVRGSYNITGITWSVYTQNAPMHIRDMHIL